MSIEEYVRRVNQLVGEDVRNEHPFRGALIELLESHGNDLLIVNDPGATEHGNPDIHVLRNQVGVGFVETKARAKAEFW